MSVRKSEIIPFLDTLLRTTEINDVSDNGLQVEAPDMIDTIGFAVDATEESFKRAIARKCGLLITHHGILWSKAYALVGPDYRRIKLLVEGNCGLYASHLPLDLHPEYGNNAQICKALRLQNIVPFGDYHGILIGFGGILAKPVSEEELCTTLAEITGYPLLAKTIFHGGQCSRIAVVSGGAPDLAIEAAHGGYDTFITGDASHQAAAIAREYGINIISAGHYATETFGVKALQKLIAEKFPVQTVFIDVPTGL
jgi:dinuclear metal center YbgI/SA1388 family protein